MCNGLSHYASLGVEVFKMNIYTIVYYSNVYVQLYFQ